MAVKPQYKANQLAKDLNIKSKEIVDVMAKKGIELKAQKALEPHEFNVLFDAITAEYQVEEIYDYIDGITYIPSKLENTDKDEKPAQAEAVEEMAKEETKEEKAAPAAETVVIAAPEEKRLFSKTPVSAWTHTCRRLHPVSRCSSSMPNVSFRDSCKILIGHCWNAIHAAILKLPRIIFSILYGLYARQGLKIRLRTTSPTGSLIY